MSLSLAHTDVYWIGLTLKLQAAIRDGHRPEPKSGLTLAGSTTPLQQPSNLYGSSYIVWGSCFLAASCTIPIAPALPKSDMSASLMCFVSLPGNITSEVTPNTPQMWHKCMGGGQHLCYFWMMSGMQWEVPNATSKLHWTHSVQSSGSVQGPSSLWPSNWTSCFQSVPIPRGCIFGEEDYATWYPDLPLRTASPGLKWVTYLCPSG